MPKQHNRKITIQGQIVSCEYDELDQVTGILFSGDDDKTFWIRPQGLGRELMEYFDQYVEVTGPVRKVRGEYHLGVSTYRLMEEMVEEERGT